MYLLALSEELPCCFSEKEVISVTPMYKWDLLYECATLDVQKGLRFCLRLSFTLYCHGLPVPKEKKKYIKAIQISYSKLSGCSFVFCGSIDGFRALKCSF